MQKPLEKGELEQIIQETRPDVRTPHEHYGKVYFHSSRKLAERMKLDWRAFSHLFGRRARTTQLIAEYQSAGINMLPDELTEEEERLLQRKMKQATEQLRGLNILTDERFERAVKDIKNTYEEAVRENVAKKVGLEEEQIRTKLPMYLQQAHLVLLLLQLKKVAEKHGEQKAKEYLQAVTMSQEGLPKLLEREWKK